MADVMIERLAKVLVHYSLGVKKGDWVRVDGPTFAEDLLVAASVEILRAGGHPTVQASLPGLRYAVVTNSSEEQLKFMPPSAVIQIDKCDRWLAIWGNANTKELSNVDPKRMAVAQLAMKPLFDKMLKRIADGSLHWTGTQYPCNASAQDAEMSLEEYRDFVFRAGMIHKKDPVAEWKKVSREQARIAKRLGHLKTLRIVGKDTDLTFNVAGRKWINCDGHENFPDGEVFTGPVENSADGHIRYTFPAVHGGREVHDVRLVFKKGRVVEARAAKGEEYLHVLIDSDGGARYVGELAFGTNYGIRRFTRNTLFDEKIGGTMHIALGASLPESGGKNKSGLHWDMVCDTRKGFTVYGDGRPIHRNGRFLKP